MCVLPEHVYLHESCIHPHSQLVAFLIAMTKCLSKAILGWRAHCGVEGIVAASGLGTICSNT